METALTRATRSYAALVVGVLMVALIAALALVGPPSGLPQLHFEARGIMQGQPTAIERVEIRTDRDSVAFRRKEVAQSFRVASLLRVPNTIA